MGKESENSRKTVKLGAPASERAATVGGARAMGGSESAEKPTAGFGNEAIGRLVMSTAGHDKGSFLVIVGVVDENHVLVADGKLRPVSKPKKKKLRHLSVKAAFSEELNKMLLEGVPVQDAALRRFIASALPARAE